MKKSSRNRALWSLSARRLLRGRLGRGQEVYLLCGSVPQRFSCLWQVRQLHIAWLRSLRAFLTRVER